jgi:hypothetical protein
VVVEFKIPQRPISESQTESLAHTFDMQDHAPHVLIWRGVTAIHVSDPYFCKDFSRVFQILKRGKIMLYQSRVTEGF